MASLELQSRGYRSSKGEGMIEPKINELVVVTVERQDVERVAVFPTEPQFSAEQYIGFVAFLDTDAVYVAQGGFLGQAAGAQSFSGVIRIPRGIISDIAQLRRYTKVSGVAGVTEPTALGAQPGPTKPRVVAKEVEEPPSSLEQERARREPDVDDLPMRDGKGN